MTQGLRLALTFFLLWTNAAGATSEAVTDTLDHTRTAACTPAMKRFCENIHIGCSGRSRIPAVPFVITLEGDLARLKTAAPATRSAMLPRTGSINWADHHAYLIVRFRPGADYLKIKSDGSYSYRHYNRGKAYMSYGRCR